MIKEKCTFKPKINRYRREGYKTKTNLSIKRGIELYDQGRGLRERKGRNKIDVEYENNKDECTFKPVIYTKRNTEKNTNIIQRKKKKNLTEKPNIQ